MEETIFELIEQFIPNCLTIFWWQKSKEENWLSTKAAFKLLCLRKNRNL